MSTERKKRLTPLEWAKAESMYESGEYTLEDIANEFNIHEATVQRHMRKRGIEKGIRAEKIKKVVEAEIEDKAKEEAELLSRRIQETKEEHYRLNSAIDKRIAREIITVEQQGLSIATAGAAFKALKIAAEAIKITRENRYAILGLNDQDNDTDELPTLIVREMLDEEIAEIRDAQQRDAIEMGLDE